MLSIGSKADPNSAGFERAFRRLHIAPAIVRVRKKMKKGPIVPDVECIGRQIGLSYVRFDPRHILRAVAESVLP